MSAILVLIIQKVSALIALKVFSVSIRIKIIDFFLILLVGIGGGMLLPHIGITVSIMMSFLLLFYTCLVLNYNFKKALFLSTFTMINGIVSDYISSMFLNFFFDETAFINEYLLFIHLIVSSMSMITFALIFTKATKKIRIQINQNEEIQTLLASISTIILISVYVSIILATYLGSDISLIQLNFIFLVSYLLVGLIIFYLYTKILNEKHEIERREKEEESLLEYTRQIEEQHTDLRKFKHDYQNILKSMTGYFDENDFEGLKTYYKAKIHPTSALINQYEFKFQPLGNIKIKEIKSILSTKLMLAETAGIDFSFESKDVIEKIPLDSLILVRSLGIVLDNAIEELSSLNEGTLTVAAFKDESVTTFIIKNTCRTNIEKLHKLKQSGFSTKESGRGIGLNSLADFAKENPKMRIDTSIEGNQFIQKIIIKGD